LLANVTLSVLDEHFAEDRTTQSLMPTDRDGRSRHGLVNYRLVRYADDFARHEAPRSREEVQDLLRWAVAAAR
jgi:hypothetical protein